MIQTFAFIYNCFGSGERRLYGWQYTKHRKYNDQLAKEIRRQKELAQRLSGKRYGSLKLGKRGLPAHRR